jgi:hypothetical protein
MCDLALSIKGSELETRIEKALDELRANDLDFKPHFWLSDEWFCADGIPGIAIPFYLAHPRLERLERSQLLEVEGGDEKWCLKILRHELGHAIENAFRTRRLKARRELFGKSTEPYPEYYSPRPYSKSFVLHLDPWYAQSHPDEDFAETFAVWLTPNSQWRDRYAGWPALKKLEYMDSLMNELRGKRAPRRFAKEQASCSQVDACVRQRCAIEPQCTLLHANIQQRISIRTTRKRRHKYTHTFPLVRHTKDDRHEDRRARLPICLPQPLTFPNEAVGGSTLRAKRTQTE